MKDVLEQIVDKLISEGMLSEDYRKDFIIELDHELRRYSRGVASTLARKTISMLYLGNHMEEPSFKFQ